MKKNVSVGVIFLVFIFLTTSCNQNCTNEKKNDNNTSEKKSEQIKKLPLKETMESNLVFPYSLPEQSDNFYNRMAPLMGEKTADIHFNKHHAGYVKKFNKAIKGTDMESIKLFELFQNVSQYPEAIRKNGGGHYNHVLFWESISAAESQPGNKLMDAIAKDFGSYDALKERFLETAKTHFGSGWAWLSIDEKGKLFVSSTANQDNPLMDVVEEKGYPILALDIWEHSYYLQYQNKRGEYVDAFWKYINWEGVEKRFDEIMKQL